MLLNNHFTHDARVLKEAKSLVKNNYEVTIRCYWDSNLLKKENHNDINIERVLYTSRAHKKNLFHKIYLLMVFLFSAFKNSKSFDFIHCHDLQNLPIGVLLKWLNRTNQKVIYDSHEYQIEQSGKPKWLRPFLKCLERFFIQYVDHVITVSDSIANEYSRLYNITKPTVILNCPPYQETNKQDLFRIKFGISDESVIFLYQGGFSRNRGIEDILETFSQIDDPRKVIVFMGYGVLEAEIKIAADSHENIFYHEAVSQDVLLDYTASADVGILTYQNTCLNHYYCSPNKFFEYTMAGLPIIASDLYELSRLINKYDNGYLVKNGSSQDLKKCVESIDHNGIAVKRQNALGMRDEFCWENQEKLLLNIYKNLA